MRPWNFIPTRNYSFRRLQLFRTTTEGWEEPTNAVVILDLFMKVCVVLMTTDRATDYFESTFFLVALRVGTSHSKLAPFLYWCTRPTHWRVIWIHEWELHAVCYHHAKFGGHTHYGSWDMNILANTVIFLNAGYLCLYIPAHFRHNYFLYSTMYVCAIRVTNNNLRNNSFGDFVLVCPIKQFRSWSHAYWITNDKMFLKKFWQSIQK